MVLAWRYRYHGVDRFADQGERMTLQDLLNELAEAARTNRDKGTQFEKLIAIYLQTDPQYADLRRAESAHVRGQYVCFVRRLGHSRSMEFRSCPDPDDRFDAHLPARADYLCGRAGLAALRVGDDRDNGIMKEIIEIVGN